MGSDPAPMASVFLSSMTWEFTAPDDPDAKRLIGLRKQAHNENAPALWVAEVDNPSLAFRPPLEIVDELFTRIREAAHFVCVLGGRRRGENEHGSPIEIIDRQSAVSYFESELFMAVLAQKPMTVLVAKGYSPGPRLAKLLDLLRESLPPERWHAQLDKSAILREIRHVVVGARRRPRLWSQRSTQRVKCAALAAKYRAAMLGGRAVGERRILFLGGAGEYRRFARPDKELVAHLLSEAQTSLNADAKLGRIWIAIRELMMTPMADESSVDLLQLWNEALGQWTTASAWYGLHGHFDLGVVASTFSTAQVRERLKDKGATLPPELTEYPGGAIASALYSVAKWMPTKAMRREVLLDGQAHLQRAMASSAGDGPGHDLMAGSYQSALNGVRAGLPHFFNAVKTAERCRQNPGIAHSELGAALMRAGRPLAGLRHLRLGVDALAQFGDGQTPEYARSLKKLAVGYTLCGRLGRAYATRKTLRALVEKRGYHDQGL